MNKVCDNNVVMTFPFMSHVCHATENYRMRNIHQRMTSPSLSFVYYEEFIAVSRCNDDMDSLVEITNRQVLATQT